MAFMPGGFFGLLGDLEEAGAVLLPIAPAE